MKNVTRTIWGAALQAYQLAGLPYSTPVNTTLNELYNIQSGVQPTATPAIGYMGVGNGAHVAATGSNGFPLMITVPHFCTDAALFNGTPLLMRPLTSDITPAQMASYGMRVVKTYNGIQYACYYLKKIDLSSVAPVINYNANNNGTIAVTPYAATSNNLNPTKPSVAAGGTIQTSADYLTVQMVLSLGFTENDAVEFVNCATIIYGDPKYAVISEIMLVTANRQTAIGAGASGQFTYNEAFGAQVHSFIDDYISVADTDQGFDFDLDLGAGEPLLTTTAPTVTSNIVTSS
jgi:hypothetical protein